MAVFGFPLPKDVNSTETTAPCDLISVDLQLKYPAQ